jgi:hypothetical protein
MAARVQYPPWRRCCCSCTFRPNVDEHASDRLYLIIPVLAVLNAQASGVAVGASAAGRANDERRPHGTRRVVHDRSDHPSADSKATAPAVLWQRGLASQR